MIFFSFIASLLRYRNLAVHQERQEPVAELGEVLVFLLKQVLALFPLFLFLSLKVLELPQVAVSRAVKKYGQPGLAETSLHFWCARVQQI
jgi:hypothetical protein